MDGQKRFEKAKKADSYTVKSKIGVLSLSSSPPPCIIVNEFRV